MLRDIILCLFIGYIFGCFQTGYIYGKCHGIDIRQYGSGNAGTTNTLRVLGKKAGYITYLGDALKAIIAILLVKYLVYGQWLVPSLSFQLLLAYTGLGVALGHNYPFYLKFKGGKGIAVTSGVMLALDLRIGLIGIIGFLILFYATRYVSVGSGLFRCILGNARTFLQIGWTKHRFSSCQNAIARSVCLSNKWMRLISTAAVMVSPA